MKSKKIVHSETYTIRLEKDEVVHDALTAFCMEHSIFSGTFSAIGAINDVTLGYYDMEKKSYFWKQYAHDVEVVSMLGNIACIDGVPFLHIHATISDTENNAYGGHVQRAVVAVTLEVCLHAYEGIMHRELDTCTGLKLLAV
jgi:uncharacterized protein